MVRGICEIDDSCEWLQIFNNVKQAFGSKPLGQVYFPGRRWDLVNPITQVCRWGKGFPI